MGRKLTIDDENINKPLLTALRAGNTIADACAYAGIGLSTYHYWLAVARAIEDDLPHDGRPKGKGKAEKEQLYLNFLDETTRARALARVSAATYLRSVITNEDIDPRVRTDAAKFILERTDPENWGRQRTDVHSEGTLEIVIKRES